MTVYLGGYHGDSCRTFTVGNVAPETRALGDAARACMVAGTRVCAPGVPFNAIGAAIESHARAAGLRICPVFCGHGIGQTFHGD